MMQGDVGVGRRVTLLVETEARATPSFFEMSIRFRFVRRLVYLESVLIVGGLLRSPLLISSRRPRPFPVQLEGKRLACSRSEKDQTASRGKAVRSLNANDVEAGRKLVDSDESVGAREHSLFDVAASGPAT
jgi:hypothetical protein